MEVETSVIRQDAVPLRVGLVRPPGRGPRGAVVLLPGRAEFIEKYATVMADLAGRGFAVGALDWRGQGLSQRSLLNPRKHHVRRFEDYLDDLRAVLDWLDAQGLPPSRVLLAHSMGGHIALRYLATRPRGIAAAVLTAPMCGINLHGVPEPLARRLAALITRLGLGHLYAPGQSDQDRALAGLESNPLTSCIEHIARYAGLVDDQPALGIGGVTWGWLAASLRSMRMMRAAGAIEAIDVPVLVCRSGVERIVDNAAMAALARRLPGGRLEDFPAARHEVMMEVAPIRRRFLELFEAFVEPACVAPIPAQPSPSSPAASATASSNIAAVSLPVFML